MKRLVAKIGVCAVAVGLCFAPELGERPVEAEALSAPVPIPPLAADPQSPTMLPTPQPVNPDPKHPTGHLIEISIRSQRLTAWSNGVVIHQFVISTGREGYETPAGHYRILEKYRNRWSRKWSVWMPYAMRWFEGYFIHQLPHKDGSSVNIGASKLGKPDSHGCIRVNVGDAQQLFNWTKLGTPVWVH